MEATRWPNVLGYGDVAAAEFIDAVQFDTAVADSKRDDGLDACLAFGSISPEINTFSFKQCCTIISDFLSINWPF